MEPCRLQDCFSIWAAVAGARGRRYATDLDSATHGGLCIWGPRRITSVKLHGNTVAQPSRPPGRSKLARYAYYREQNRSVAVTCYMTG